jgi:hypothetical protein
MLMPHFRGIKVRNKGWSDRHLEMTLCMKPNRTTPNIKDMVPTTNAIKWATLAASSGGYLSKSDPNSTANNASGPIIKGFINKK